MSTDIKALAQLAIIDAALKSTEEEIAKARTTVGALEQTIRGHEVKIVGQKTQLGDLEKRQKEAHADVRSMTQQLEHSRDKMNRSRTERETNAVQREMEELRKLIRDRENEIEKLNAEAKQITDTVDTETGALGQVKGELDTLHGPANAKLAELENDRQRQIDERGAIAKTMNQALFRKYESIRAKRGSGVTTTTDGTCKACHMALAPQLFHRIRREPIIEQCPSCNRLIYFAPPEPPTAAS